MSYAAAFASDTRLAILRCLDRGGGAVNDSLVVKMMGPSERGGIDHLATPDQVRTQIAWLAEQGLLKTRPIEGSDMLSVTLLERGQLAARGRIVVPGVDEPSAPRR
ncbi:MAG: ArsR family transcriptional regulator [Rhizobiales bacterium]|nr:ArsR family transcriptional regulator [Hyphomicrobiales bacterium]